MTNDTGIADADPAKDVLRRYLTTARDALVWTLDGVSEYDARRPLTPTGTNLLGLVKHCGAVEIGYLGVTFGRPFPEPLAYLSPRDDDPTVDLWATADESRDEILALTARIAAHSDETLATHALTDTGEVPWWPADRRVVTLHLALVHLIAEVNRHAGHADILRESIDGAAGLREGHDNLSVSGADERTSYRERLEQVAQTFR